MINLKLPMNLKITQDFGGWRVERNGEIVYDPDEWELTEAYFNKQKTLMTFENMARKDDAEWKLINDTPLHYEEYTRVGTNEWILTKHEKGFME